MVFFFFYKEENNLIPVDQLGQKLLKKIGISWNKKYRKQYGPLRKVIHDIFFLSSFLNLHPKIYSLMRER